MAQDIRRKLDYLLFSLTRSSPVGEFVSELQTTETPEGIMKHGIYIYIYIYIIIARLCGCLGKKGKAIPVTGRGGLLGCETSRLPQFLDNRLTDGGEVVSLKRRPLFTPIKIPGTHFLKAGRIRSIEKSNYVIGKRTRDL
jgi:hypothetical protein